MFGLLRLGLRLRFSSVEPRRPKLRCWSVYAVISLSIQSEMYTIGGFVFRSSEILGSLVDSSQVAIFQTLISA